jgi:hypothetical protein
MKSSITLVASLLILLVALVLKNATDDSSRASKDTPPTIKSEQSARNVHPRRKELRAVVATPPTPLIYADLLGAIETETDLDRRSEALDLAVESVRDSELPGLLDSLVWLESSAAADFRQRLIRRWAEMDGPAAVAWASKLWQDPNYHETLMQVALGWAGTDLSATLDWAHTLPESDAEAVMLGLGYETIRTDAVTALEVAASLGPTRLRDELIEHAISQWATTDFAAALQWADGSVSDPGLRQRLLAAVAVAVAGQDGATAATLAATALDPGDQQDRVAVAIVQRWAQNEPELAASWVAQFPDTRGRETTAENLVAFWAVHDREATAKWLRALPEGALRTVGMAAYAQVQPTSD